MKVDVAFEERYWYPDDGGVVWLAGYSVIDPESGRFLPRSAPELIERGIRIASAAGAGRHHAEVVAKDTAAPGSTLVLRRDPANEHDPNAIAVDTEDGQVGWVPRELAEELAPRLDDDEPWSAIVLREQRPSPRDPRTGITILLAPVDRIELSVRPHGS